MKINTQIKLEEKLKDIKSQNKTVVLTNGCFDILHAGHVRYLQKSKALGDYLIVCLNSDKSVSAIKGPTRPINNEQDRAEVLSALEAVDFVVIFDEDSPKDLITKYQPDIYTKGADYTLDTLPETPYVQSYGGKIEFIELVEGKSTTNIIEKSKS